MRVTWNRKRPSSEADIHRMTKKRKPYNYPNSAASAQSPYVPSTNIDDTAEALAAGAAGSLACKAPRPPLKGPTYSEPPQLSSQPFLDQLSKSQLEARSFRSDDGVVSNNKKTSLLPSAIISKEPLVLPSTEELHVSTESGRMVSLGELYVGQVNRSPSCPVRLDRDIGRQDPHITLAQVSNTTVKSIEGTSIETANGYLVAEKCRPSNPSRAH